MWLSTIVIGLTLGLGTLLIIRMQAINQKPLEQIQGASFSLPFQNKTQLRDTSLVGDLSFFGNMFWGRYIHDWSQASVWGYDYPFLGLNEFGKVATEYWISGLECPLADTNPTSAEQEEALKFNCREEYVPKAARWIDAFSLANNHMGDQEQLDGFARTKTILTQNSIDSFGSFDNRAGDICKVLQVRFYDMLGSEKLIPIAFCGYHWVFGVPTSAQLAKITRYSRDYITIVLPHGGAEYVPRPDQLKTVLYRQMVDAGADMVIGDHPHVTQTTELYDGKLIVYSLGNFLFDQQTTFALTRSLSVRAKIQIANYQEGVKPEYTVDYSARCTDNSGRKLKKASPEDCDKVLQAAAWKFAVEY